MLGPKRDDDGEAWKSENFPRVIVSWLWEPYYRYRAAVSAVTRYRGEVSSPRASDPDAPAASADNYVNVDGKAD